MDQHDPQQVLLNSRDYCASIAVQAMRQLLRTAQVPQLEAIRLSSRRGYQRASVYFPDTESHARAASFPTRPRGGTIRARRQRGTLNGASFSYPISRPRVGGPTTVRSRFTLCAKTDEQFVYRAEITPRFPKAGGVGAVKRSRHVIAIAPISCYRQGPACLF